MQYDVTIGIPVFCVKDYIRNTMLSALAQTYHSIEFLVIDDCGNDGSMAIVDELQRSHSRGSHIRIIRNPGNLGVGICRNCIIDEAKGRYLYFLDSDDVMEPGTIQLMVDAMTNDNVEIVYASYEIVDNVNHTPDRVYQKPFSRLLLSGELALYVFKHVDVFHVSVCNCLIDMNFLRQSGARFIDTMYWEDMAFTYELVPLVSRAVLLPDVTYHYIQHSGSLSHYQERETLEKAEVLRNVSTVQYLKGKCSSWEGKRFLPYLCYNLEMNCFYMVCHIIKHSNRIVPSFTFCEMRNILSYPLPLRCLLCFREKLLPNLFMWLLGHTPMPLFKVLIWFLGKLKGAI